MLHELLEQLANTRDHPEVRSHPGLSGVDLPYPEEAHGLGLSGAVDEVMEVMRGAVRMRISASALALIEPLLKQPARLMVGARSLFCPAPVTWIETEEAPSRRLGILLTTFPETGLQVGSAMMFTRHPIRGDLVSADFDFDLRDPRRVWRESVKGLWEEEKEERSGVTAWEKHIALEHYAKLTVAILSLLSSPRICEVRKVDFEKVNRRRTKRGKYPLLAYNEVTIRLFNREPGHALATGTGSPRPLHFVRAYLRLLSTGTLVFVHPHWRGDAELGIRRPAYRLTA